MGDQPRIFEPSFATYPSCHVFGTKAEATLFEYCPTRSNANDVQSHRWPCGHSLLRAKICLECCANSMRRKAEHTTYHGRWLCYHCNLSPPVTRSLRRRTGIRPIDSIDIKRDFGRSKRDTEHTTRARTKEASYRYIDYFTRINHK